MREELLGLITYKLCSVTVTHVPQPRPRRVHVVDKKSPADEKTMGAEQSSGARRYRGTKRPRDERETDHLERALELLEENSHSSLAHTRPPPIKGPVSWASVGAYACDVIKRELARARNADDLHEAIEHARILESRLRKRDGVKGARTTLALRDTITNLAALTKALGEMVAIQSGVLEPNYDNAGRATVIRRKVVKLGLGDTPWIKRVMEETVAAVLASNASGGVKALFNRAMASFLPTPPPTEGTQVEWDSD